MGNYKKLVGMILGLLLLLFWWGVYGQTYTIVITQEELVKKLEEKFPFEKKYLFLLSLQFSNPRIALLEGSNRVKFGCDIRTNVKLSKGDSEIPEIGSAADLSGVLRYDPEKAEFFLDHPEVEKLVIAGIEAGLSDKVSSFAKKGLEEFLQRAPLYKLKPTDVKKAAAKLVLKNVVVAEGKLVITLGVG